MYKKPSRKRKSKQMERLNLIPILDAIFIFIFFLLMSSNFVKLHEIRSDVPIISNRQPPKSKRKNLNLTLKIFASKLTLHKGVREKLFKTIPKKDGGYNLYQLRESLITLKKSYKQEETIIFMPKSDINYEQLVQIMDAVRDLKDTDPEIWYKDKKTNEDTKVTKLFNNIIFGDTQS